MSEAERAFYEWFHSVSKSGVLLERYREAFLAGWFACQVGEVRTNAE
jgi:hypothetical protein